MSVFCYRPHGTDVDTTTSDSHLNKRFPGPSARLLPGKVWVNVPPYFGVNSAVARKSSKDDTFDFEQALSELEKLVERMEQGDLSLEQSLKDFERGIELTRACQGALKQAEQKVQILTAKGGTETLEPFEGEE